MGGGGAGELLGLAGQAQLDVKRQGSKQICAVQQLLHPDAGGDCYGPHWMCCVGATPGCVGAYMLAGESWILYLRKHMRTVACLMMVGTNWSVRLVSWACIIYSE